MFGAELAWYSSRSGRALMARYPRAHALTYSFGPGPITPAVRILLWANIAVYVATLIFRPLVDWLGLIPKQVIEQLVEKLEPPT